MYLSSGSIYLKCEIMIFHSKTGISWTRRKNVFDVPYLLCWIIVFCFSHNSHASMLVNSGKRFRWCFLVTLFIKKSRKRNSLIYLHLMKWKNESNFHTVVKYYSKCFGKLKILLRKWKVKIHNSSFRYYYLIILSFNLENKKTWTRRKTIFKNKTFPLKDLCCVFLAQIS